MINSNYLKFHICSSCQLRKYGSRTITSEENCPQNLTLTNPDPTNPQLANFHTGVAIFLITIRGNCLDTKKYITFCVMFISKRQNKYCNLLFLAICHLLFPIFRFDISCVILPIFPIYLVLFLLFPAFWDQPPFLRLMKDSIT